MYLLLVLSFLCVLHMESIEIDVFENGDVYLALKILFECVSILAQLCKHTITSRRALPGYCPKSCPYASSVYFDGYESHHGADQTGSART